MVNDWFPKKNLRPFLEVCASLVQYHLDEWDWEAISYGIKEPNHQFDYIFEGHFTVAFFLSYEPENESIAVHAESSAEIERQLEMAIQLMQDYLLTPIHAVFQEHP